MRPGILLAIAGVVAGCAFSTPPDPTAAAGALRHFDEGGVAFDFSARWGSARFDVSSSFSSSIVFLSTSRLADPCDRGPDSVACVREAAAALDPDGILVVWSRNGFPGWTFDPTKGQPVAVGGRPATVEDLAPDDSCRAIGGERQVVVTIPIPASRDNWTSVTACLRGPDLDALRTELGAMLASVAWHS